MQQFTGTQYLAIDIANAYGLDNLTWDERLKWFDINEHALESLTGTAKEPAQFMAGVFAWRDTQMGIPTGYMCGLDATASGIQLLSVMSGCFKSAAACNLVETGKREDAYVRTHEKMTQLLGTATNFNRKDTKAALMTHMYASKAVPKRVFGEDTPALAAFYEAVDTLMPGANELNKALLNLWNPNTLAHSWTMPDGFDVKIKVVGHVIHNIEFLGNNYEVVEEVNMPLQKSLSLPANIVHSIDGFVVREMNRRCNYNKDHVSQVRFLFTSKGYGMSTSREMDITLLRMLALYDLTGMFSISILRYVDFKNMSHVPDDLKAKLVTLIDSLPKEPFELVAIHDCFRFHANNGNDVRQQYVNILAELADSHITKGIAEELLGQTVNVPKRIPNLSKYILESEYALS